MMARVFVSEVVECLGSYRLMARVYKRFYRDDHLAAQHLRQAKQLREQRLNPSNSTPSDDSLQESSDRSLVDLLDSVKNQSPRP